MGRDRCDEKTRRRSETERLSGGGRTGIATLGCVVVEFASRASEVLRLGSVSGAYVEESCDEAEYWRWRVDVFGASERRRGRSEGGLVCCLVRQRQQDKVP